MVASLIIPPEFRDTSEKNSTHRYFYLNIDVQFITCCGNFCRNWGRARSGGAGMMVCIEQRGIPVIFAPIVSRLIRSEEK